MLLVVALMPVRQMDTPMQSDMYGWSWAHSASGTAQNWQPESALPLVRVGDSFVYEGTCYVFSWAEI